MDNFYIKTKGKNKHYNIGRFDFFYNTAYWNILPMLAIEWWKKPLILELAWLCFTLEITLKK